MSHPVDPADEAGGEVVFSSEGLDPIPVTKPPSIVQSSTTATGEDEVILDSSDPLSPQAAFEVFQGKLYHVQTQATTTANNTETPLERLARLQQEVSQLEEELKLEPVSGQGRDFDEELVALASSLQSRLVTASETHQQSCLEQEDLTRLIRQQKDALESGTTRTTTTTSTGADADKAGNTGVVYELYPTHAGGPATSTMEERLLQLERLMGGGSNTTTTSSSSSSLLNRLDNLESLLQTVNPTVLEQTATKAKVIRADLEAASKARNKLTATYKKEDSKMIQQLHQQMVELEGLSGYLPKLVERLQQLASMHVQASTVGSRLEALEGEAQQLGVAVSKMEETATALQTNMVENMVTMERNMSRLDERLKGKNAS